MDEIQKSIIRQSSMKLAIRLLTSEQEIAKNSAKIPLESIKSLTKELEEFVYEVNETKVANSKAVTTSQSKGLMTKEERRLVM